MSSEEAEASNTSETTSTVETATAVVPTPKTGPMWPEVKQAFEGKRYELCLVGPEISKRIEDNNSLLDTRIFNLKHLNFLEIAKTKLKTLPLQIAQLENLTSLLCHSNELTSLPNDCLGKLVNIKNLDFSNNKLTELPQDLKNLKELFTINLCGNNLTALFPLEGLSKLAVLDISRNKFVDLPMDLSSPTLENLSQVNASFNQIVEFSDSLFVELPSLKLLNLENNVLIKVPSNLSQCAKLKDLLLKENKLKDNRLKKLVEQNKGKAIIEYLERLYIEESKTKPKVNKEQPGSVIAKKKKAAIQQIDYDLIKVLHLNQAKTPCNEVTMSDTVAEIRPFIVCCIIRQLDLETPGNFKKFLNIQTKLQDELCEKRTLATIATHDLEKVKSNLIYDAEDPDKIELVPLGRKYPITAADFYEKLTDEAEAERKQKKRNQISGIFKYLNLLQDAKKFAFVKDKSNQVLSLPPLTNCEDTKMSAASKNILIEITSTTSQEFCKNVMEQLFTEMLNNGIVSHETAELNVESLTLNDKPVETETKSSNGDSNGETSRQLRHTLIIQQVRILDPKGALKSVYPSRVDLSFNGSNKFQVNRLYEDSNN